MRLRIVGRPDGHLGRTYAEVKHRPLWLVDYTLNLAENQKPAAPAQPRGNSPSAA